MDKKIEKEIIQTRLEEYIGLYNELKEKTGGDDRVALGILAELKKDLRMEQMRAEREVEKLKPATAAQKRYLKKLKVEVPSDAELTKERASELIDEALAKQSDEESAWTPVPEPIPETSVQAIDWKVAGERLVRDLSNRGLLKGRG